MLTRSENAKRSSKEEAGFKKLGYSKSPLNSGPLMLLREVCFARKITALLLTPRGGRLFQFSDSSFFRFTFCNSESES